MAITNFKFSKKSPKKATKKLTSKVKKPKIARVTRAFLLGLADDIFNAKTKTFLNLCNGVLQNGPDPIDEERPMHCGLGELYFAMTGLQPKETNVSEDEVVALAVKQSELFAFVQKRVDDARQTVNKLVLPADIKRMMKLPLSVHPVDNLCGDDVTYNELEFHDPKLEKLRLILDQIPSVNDKDGVDKDFCTPQTFKARAKRVADILRKAAALLPAKGK